MSRVDDDREAARVSARLAEAKRTEESARTKRAAQDNAFSKLVQAQKQSTVVMQEGALAKSAIAQLLEAAEAGELGQAKQLAHGSESAQHEGAFKAKLGTAGQEHKVHLNTRSEGQKGEQAKTQGDQSAAATASGRHADQAGASSRAQGRSGDAKVGRDRLDERKEASQAGGQASTGSSSAIEGKGELKTDADKGGGQNQSGGKEGKEGGAGAGTPGFRFNPALMAPVPVAKTKEASGSERLRKVANELAQKIVDKVRIGTNAAGKMEFQIDLKSDVLSGLSVRVSAHQGKIKAVFQGSDKDVLKMIEEQGEVLKSALGTRGLTLEDFKVETRG